MHRLDKVKVEWNCREHQGLLVLARVILYPSLAWEIYNSNVMHYSQSGQSGLEASDNVLPPPSPRSGGSYVTQQDDAFK